jgi:hypothetical protein
MWAQRRIVLHCAGLRRTSPHSLVTVGTIHDDLESKRGALD